MAQIVKSLRREAGTLEVIVEGAQYVASRQRAALTGGKHEVLVGPSGTLRDPNFELLTAMLSQAGPDLARQAKSSAATFGLRLGKFSGAALQRVTNR